MSQQRDYHFFTSSASNWTTNASLRECIRLQEAADRECTYMQPRGYSVYKVLLPSDAKYRIGNYVPEVDPEKLIKVDTILYVQGKTKRGPRVKAARGKAAIEQS